MEKNSIRFMLGAAALLMSSSPGATIPWEQTKGPYGGFVTAFCASGDTVFAALIGGIARSNDGGKNWSVVLSEPSRDTIKHVIVERNSVYALGRGYLLQSVNGGSTWAKKVLPGSASCLALAGEALFIGAPGGIQRSVDKGLSWTTVDSIYGWNPAHFFVQDSTIVCVRSVSDSAVISTDCGRNWTMVPTRGTPSGTASIYAVASSGSTLFIGTNYGVFMSEIKSIQWSFAGLSGKKVRSLSIRGSTLYAGGGGVFRAIINGADWTECSAGLPSSASITALLAGRNAIIAGTNGLGVFESANGGDAWSASNSGLSFSDIKYLTAAGKTLFAGFSLQASSASSDKGQNWSPNWNQSISSGVSVGGVAFAGTGNGIFQSTDNGAQWTPDTVGVGKRTVYCMAEGRQNELFAGTEQGLFRSKDLGARWTLDSAGMTPGRMILSLVVHDAVLFTGGYGIWKSNDNGVNLTPDTAGMGFGRVVFSLYENGNMVLAGTSNGVYRSTITGAGWSHDTVNFKYGNGYYSKIYSIVGSGDTVYAATSNGVYVSSDMGTHWIGDTLGMGGRTANAIAVCEGYLFAAAENSGVWRRPLSNTVGARNLRPLSPISPKPEFDIRLGGLKAPAAIVFSIPSSQKVNLAAYDLSGREIGSLADKSFGPGLHSIIWDTRAVSPGCYVVKMRAGSIMLAKRAAVSR